MAETPNGVVVIEDEVMHEANEPQANETRAKEMHPTMDEVLALKATFTERLVISSTMYIIPVKWFVEFSTWASGGDPPPPCDPIDLLCDADGFLRTDIIECKDWYATTEQGWQIVKKYVPCTSFVNCRYGIASECPCAVIPEYKGATVGVVELSSPRILLTKLTMPPNQSAALFDFSPRTIPEAPIIQVSKADTVDHLRSLIYAALDVPKEGEIRCYKLSITKSDSIRSEMTTHQVVQYIQDRENAFPLPESSASFITELGIVESYLGLAVEHKPPNDAWPLTDEAFVSDRSSAQDSSTSDAPSSTSSVDLSGGRTLGSSPSGVLTLRRAADRSVLDSDEEGSLGKVNGLPVAGPSLPVSFAKRSPPPAIGTSRYVRSALTSRFALENILVRGTTGLTNLGTLLNASANLGNTCYMNSALQCLVHCKELTDYFLFKVYKRELNFSNPLGMQGHLATAYAHLVQQLFPSSTGPKTALRPADFKSVIGEYATNFRGWGQQDSQEFLEFLLDGLHEDLNRIRSKPYIERDEIMGAELTTERLRELGIKSWGSHKLRNDSVIVDLCQGLYKSTVVCPVCEVVSVTFDPFMDLSVPLPVKQTCVLREEG
jgi:Ubiquitin carboxyl-terminal hydrolase